MWCVSPTPSRTEDEVCISPNRTGVVCRVLALALLGWKMRCVLALIEQE